MDLVALEMNRDGDMNIAAAAGLDVAGPGYITFLANPKYEKLLTATQASAIILREDAPAAPCLSSRVVYGLEITPRRLRQVEEGEAYLRTRGVAGDLRVRHHGNRARIEVAPDALAALRADWTAIAQVFRGLGFDAVELDPAGYRRGCLLALAPQSPA